MWREKEQQNTKSKEVEKTIWNRELMNDIIPVWQKPSEEIDKVKEARDKRPHNV